MSSGVMNLTNKVTVQVSVSNTGTLINSNKPIAVVSNTNSLLNSSLPIALKNNPTFSSTLIPATNTLENLLDVTVIDKTENSTLSYSQASDKYEIKQLKLDGGIF